MIGQQSNIQPRRTLAGRLREHVATDRMWRYTEYFEPTFACFIHSLRLIR